MEIYVVQSGDTLYRIAQKFGVTVTAIQQLNQFSNPNQLVVGQAILIPTPPSPALQYTVVAGDTLYIIAQLFNTTVQAIAQANNITNPNQLQVGTVLTIPGWTSQTYTVRSGDTLSRIAAQFNVTVNQIAKLNQIVNPALIYPGQILMIPQPGSVVIPKTIESFGYFQLFDLAGLEQTLAQIGSYFTWGGLFHYQVDANGAINIPGNTANAVALLKRYQVRPLAVLTNWGTTLGTFDPDLARTLLGNSAIRSQTITNTLNLVKQYGMSGVNVDFENMYPEDRPLYTQFIQELTAALNAQGYVSSIAVAPKYADLPTYAWVGAFDYAALGAAANFIFLMTYEWGWIGGPPSPIAPINLVRRVIAYATSLVPANKLIQGVPLYGYNWTLPDTPENLATTVNLSTVTDLAYRFGAVINYDTAAQSPWFRYTNETGTQHEVWFEDARSVEAKYQLAREFNLRGVGFWSHINYPYGFPQNWPVLGKYFNIVK